MSPLMRSLCRRKQRCKWKVDNKDRLDSWARKSQRASCLCGTRRQFCGNDRRRKITHGGVNRALLVVDVDRRVTVRKPGVLSDAAAKGNPQLLEQWDYLHRVFLVLRWGESETDLGRERLGDPGKVRWTKTSLIPRNYSGWRSPRCLPSTGKPSLYSADNSLEDHGCQWRGGNEIEVLLRGGVVTCSRNNNRLKFLALDRYTKYPPTTASFHVRSTDGAMPTGKSFSAFQKLWTPAPKRVRAIFGAGFILRKPGMITSS